MNSHILLVDDEPPVRELLSLCLRKQGFQATSATTGAQARQLARTAAFDLVILDLHLPGENGLELLRFFKAKNPNMPVMIYTGLGSDEGLVAQARAGGASAILDKTESLYTLLAEVRRQLRTAANRSPLFPKLLSPGRNFHPAPPELIRRHTSPLLRPR